jgi:hypothetical protein
MCWEGHLCNISILGLWYDCGADIDASFVIFNPVQAIATRTFFVLFLRLPAKRSTMWIVLVGNWSFLFSIVIAGPATAMIQKDGPYCEHSPYESPFLSILTMNFRWHRGLLVLDICRLYVPARRVRILDRKTPEC